MSEFEAEMTSEEFGKQFMTMINDAPDGQIKQASAAMSKTTRRKLREDAFSPAIIPHDTVSDADLDYFVDHERPAIICDMEPDSPGAKSISFQDTADQTEFFGNKYLLMFYTNTTPEWVKNVHFLRTYRNDLRQIITDNSLRDLSRQKDVHFMTDVEAIVGVDHTRTSPLTGLQQFVKYPGRLTKDNWVSSTYLLSDRSLMNGVFLCNMRTFGEIRRWGRDEMGGDFTQELTLKGTAAFAKSEFSGIDFIVTMKHDLVPNGTIYEFAPANYLGRAAVLKAPTMYVEKKKDMLHFSCREILGVTIANTAAVQKVEYEAITGLNGGDGRLA